MPRGESLKLVAYRKIEFIRKPGYPVIRDDHCTLEQKGGEYLCMPGACFSLSDSFMLESIVTRSMRVFETRLHGFPSRPGLISERVWQVVHARCIALLLAGFPSGSAGEREATVRGVRPATLSLSLRNDLVQRNLVKIFLVYTV
uniref:uncharacterized protein LOC117603095 n=1 Tax=Osmia lignaria TaxID=473952 RepID=UPI001478DA1F|nr:uncharacterized protein LOC117603095 [Osmia lignaria]